MEHFNGQKRKEEEKRICTRQSLTNFNQQNNSALRHPIANRQSENYWDDVSKQMWKEYLLNRQNENLYERKLQIWKEIFYHLHFIFPSFQFFMVGSSMGGFATKDSDMDVCLIVPRGNNLNEVDKERTCTLRYLQKVKDHFMSNEVVSKIELIVAKVPILRFRFYGEPRFYVDMNCNNPVTLQNSHLLINYSRLDTRLQPLALIVKLWAQKNNINSAFHKTLSSYSLTLLVINFLQCGVNPPILPSLQAMYPTVFCQESGLKFQSFNDSLPRYFTNNRQKLSELLIDFFTYYENFNFETYAISVRLGCIIPRPDLIQHIDGRHSLTFIYVEEPFLRANTASAVHDAFAFHRIKIAISKAVEKLKSTNSLYSIFEF